MQFYVCENDLMVNSSSMSNLGTHVGCRLNLHRIVARAELFVGTPFYFTS